MNYINGLGYTMELLIAAGAVVAMLAGFHRWVRPIMRRAKADRIATRDAIIGRPAITDSITGKEIAPALPGIGQRMASTETQVTLMADAITKLADSHEQIREMAQRQRDLEARVAALEEMGAERVIGKAESVQLYRTIEAVAKQSSIKEDEG